MGGGPPKTQADRSWPHLGLFKIGVNALNLVILASDLRPVTFVRENNLMDGLVFTN